MARVKGKKKRNIVLVFALLLFVSYIGYHFVTLQIHINEQKEALAQLQQLCAEKKISNEELNDILENGGEVEYIKKIARDKLNYVNPDERVFVDISGS